MEKDEKKLSLRLYEILEGIGASEEMRKFHNDLVVLEIIESLKYQLLAGLKVSLFICGSRFEGTTTLGMSSDEDLLIIIDGVVAISDIREAGDSLAFLMFRDIDTKPGYYKLQIVENGQVRTELKDNSMEAMDRGGRLCAKNYIPRFQEFELHGPAVSYNTTGFCKRDVTTAIRCQRIPDRYTKWISRERHSGWPSRDLLDKMAKLCCFVVYIGHEKSKERELEWRLSFSLQERELMVNLNPVQHKCYILMKMIKKDIIQPSTGGVEAISSYHCKTCLFYAIEHSSPHIWTPDNLVPCLFRCLHILFDCVTRSECRNYFIEDANLFDRDVFRQNRDQLLKTFQEIFRLGYRVLSKLRTDKIGDKLSNKIEFKYNCKCFSYHLKQKFSIIPLCHVHDQLSVIHERFRSYSLGIFDFVLVRLLVLHIQLETYKYHSDKEKQEALSFISPWFHQWLGKALACQVLNTTYGDSARMLSQCDMHFALGLKTDLMNTRLVYAAVQYKLGNYQTCKEQLEEIHLDLADYVESVCVCKNTPRHMGCELHFLSKFHCENVKDTLHKAVVSCIKFLPSESKIVPSPLELEMYRAGYPPSASRDRLEECWLDWAVVDAKVFLFFMQYLVYSKLELKAQKDEAILNFERVLSDDIPHPETGYNLRGWIHFQETMLYEAAICWRRSMSTWPDKNAAKKYVTKFIMEPFLLFLSQPGCVI